MQILSVSTSYLDDSDETTGVFDQGWCSVDAWNPYLIRFSQSGGSRPFVILSPIPSSNTPDS